MQYWQALHFIRPMVLWLLPLIFIILWMLQKNNGREDAWSKICDPHLLDTLKINSGSKGNRWNLLLWPIFIIALLAIAGPAFRKMPTPVIKNQSALIIALDVSKSMLADDIKPNRLERAKYKINDILKMRKDGQTALLVYSGDAFVVTPLTDDIETIALMLKAISPDIMPVQGSRADIALEKSEKLLHQAGYIKGDILLLTDGVKTGAVEDVAEKLAGDRIKTSILAIGTKEGAPIPSASGFVKDSSGNIVIPKLKVSNLEQLAKVGRGRFAKISGDSSDIKFLLPTQVNNDDANKQANDAKDDAFDTEKYVDEGPWLVLLLLPLVALLYRKGIMLSLFLVVGLQTPQSSYAVSWDDLWLNSDQQAAQQLHNGKAKEALELAQSDDWKATAAFRSKEYQQASKLYNNGSADGFYNQGNALAQSGKLEEALKAYEDSLKLRANDEDTLYNKKQVEEALKKQQQENKDKQKQDQDKKDQDKKDQDKKDQDKKDQDKKDQEKQKQDQKDQDQENKDKKDGEGEKKDDKENKEQGENPEQQKQQEKQQSEMTDAEKKQQQEEQKKLEQADKEAKEKQQKEQKEVKLTPKELAEKAEDKEAIEQWLRRIPDDPGGLLRRKFYYQYNQQNNKPDEQEDW